MVIVGTYKSISVSYRFIPLQEGGRGGVWAYPSCLRVRGMVQRGWTWKLTAHRSVTYKQLLTPNLESFAYPRMHVVALWDEVTGDKPTHGSTTRKKLPAPVGPSCYEATNANHHATLTYELLKVNKFIKPWTDFTEVTQRSVPLAVLNSLHFLSSMYRSYVPRI